MKTRNLFALACLGLLFVNTAVAQEGQRDYGVCFKPIEQKAFDDAEKAGKSELRNSS